MIDTEIINSILPNSTIFKQSYGEIDYEFPFLLSLCLHFFFFINGFYNFPHSVRHHFLFWNWWSINHEIDNDRSSFLRATLEKIETKKLCLHPIQSSGWEIFNPHQNPSKSIWTHYPWEREVERNDAVLITVTFIASYISVLVWLSSLLSMRLYRHRYCCNYYSYNAKWLGDNDTDTYYKCPH